MASAPEGILLDKKYANPKDNVTVACTKQFPCQIEEARQFPCQDEEARNSFQ